jgi:hypothetical protein
MELRVNLENRYRKSSETKENEDIICSSGSLSKRNQIMFQTNILQAVYVDLAHFIISICLFQYFLSVNLQCIHLFFIMRMMPRRKEKKLFFPRRLVVFS